MFPSERIAPLPFDWGVGSGYLWSVSPSSGQEDYQSTSARADRFVSWKNTCPLRVAISLDFSNTRHVAVFAKTRLKCCPRPPLQSLRFSYRYCSMIVIPSINISTRMRQQQWYFPHDVTNTDNINALLFFNFQHFIEYASIFQSFWISLSWAQTNSEFITVA